MRERNGIINHGGIQAKAHVTKIKHPDLRELWAEHAGHGSYPCSRTGGVQGLEQEPPTWKLRIWELVAQ